MKKGIKHSKETLTQGDLNKNAETPDNIKRREALKRIAFLAMGGVVGTTLIESCKPLPYDDYSDYTDYYYDYYSRYSDYYYDYYSVYSVYWDGK
jgi:hypothetical protein